MQRRRVVLLLTTMLVALVLGSGTALALNKVCNPGSTFALPCKGSISNDTLIGTGGADVILALAGNDKISAGAGNDHTDGGAGNDIYSYANHNGSSWGTDTVVDASGVDTLNFAAATNPVSGYLTPDWDGFNSNSLSGTGGTVNVSGTPGKPSVIEKVVGSASGHDFIVTGGAANTLQPGPGTGGGHLADLGGCKPAFCSGTSLFPAVSSDTYSGLSASGYGRAIIEDYGGTADKLILPFASTSAYFEASGPHLIIMSTSTDSVTIFGQLQPWAGGIPGRIETIQFTDGVFSIGSSTQTTALNEASAVSVSEKDARSKAAKKILSEAPSSPTALQDKKSVKK